MSEPDLDMRSERLALIKALTAAWHALESYACDNASPELAEEIAAYCKATLDMAAGCGGAMSSKTAKLVLIRDQVRQDEDPGGSGGRRRGHRRRGEPRRSGHPGRGLSIHPDPALSERKKPMNESDDQLNLADLEEIEAALIDAHQALTKAMVGLGVRAEREKFVFKVGFARGKLSRITERIYRVEQA